MYGQLFSAVATDAVVVYITICFSTVVPLALSLGQCRSTFPPSESVRAMFSYTAFSLVLGSAKALRFLANLAWALYSCIVLDFTGDGFRLGLLVGDWLVKGDWLSWWGTEETVSKTAKIYQTRQLQVQPTVKRFPFDLQWPAIRLY